jgi:hypothetical protein
LCMSQQRYIAAALVSGCSVETLSLSPLLFKKLNGEFRGAARLQLSLCGPISAHLCPIAESACLVLLHAAELRFGQTCSVGLWDRHDVTTLAWPPHAVYNNGIAISGCRVTAAKADLGLGRSALGVGTHGHSCVCDGAIAAQIRIRHPTLSSPHWIILMVSCPVESDGCAPLRAAVRNSIPINRASTRMSHRAVHTTRWHAAPSACAMCLPPLCHVG